MANETEESTYDSYKRTNFVSEPTKPQRPTAEIFVRGRAAAAGVKITPLRQESLSVFAEQKFACSAAVSSDDHGQEVIAR